MIKFFTWFTFLIVPLWATTIPLTLEHARTYEEITWGLMQREELPLNHGMLFHYPREQFVSVWMFNCLKDLSAAFLDATGTILETHELKAYPNQMDAKRPVLSQKDFAKYSPYDSVYQFFIARVIRSSRPVRYLLEMDAGWFKENKIAPGDRLTWDNNSPNAYITRRNL